MYACGVRNLLAVPDLILSLKISLWALRRYWSRRHLCIFSKFMSWFSCETLPYPLLSRVALIHDDQRFLFGQIVVKFNFFPGCFVSRYGYYTWSYVAWAPGYTYAIFTEVVMIFFSGIQATKCIVYGLLKFLFLSSAAAHRAGIYKSMGFTYASNNLGAVSGILVYFLSLSRLFLIRNRTWFTFWAYRCFAVKNIPRGTKNIPIPDR